MNSLVKFVVCGIFFGAASTIFGQVSVVETKWTEYIPEESSRSIPSNTLPKLPDADYTKNGLPGGPTHPDQIQVKGTDRYIKKDTSGFYINKPGTVVAPADIFKGRAAFDLAVKFMNSGSKPIKSVEADVIFYLTNGVEEISLKLITDKNIDPGKTVKFKNTITGSTDKRYSHPLTDRSVAVMRSTLPTVVVKRIVYEDGTTSN